MLIFSSGDRSSVKNYRPISLLCSLSKVLERLVFDQMISFLSPIITQFGYLRGGPLSNSCWLTVNQDTELWSLFDQILSLTRVGVNHLVL